VENIQSIQAALTDQAFLESLCEVRNICWITIFMCTLHLCSPIGFYTFSTLRSDAGMMFRNVADIFTQLRNHVPQPRCLQVLFFFYMFQRQTPYY